MLTKSQRDRWAAALRDPSIAGKQARKAWRREGDRCCLTVFCDLEGKSFEASAESAWLYGMLGDRAIEQFVAYNDYEYLTFPEIADKVDALPVLADAGQEATNG